MQRKPCPSCRAMGRDKSGDNLVVYPDGSSHCFSCHYDSRKAGHKEEEDVSGYLKYEDIAGLPRKALSKRGISGDIAQHFGVHTEINQETGEDEAYYFPLYRGGRLVGYQGKPASAPGQRRSVRNPFRLGDTSGTSPFGSHVSGSSGRLVVVTEGAEDALATTQMMRNSGKNYRVVATLGTTGWKNTLDFFLGFEHVIIAYDQDEAGVTAANEFASALRPGQAKIMQWDAAYSDPNACLIANKGQMFFDALMNANEFKPEGFITGKEVWDIMEGFVEPDYYPYPPEWALMNEKMKGIRLGEISLWTAGSSVGKTSFIRRLKQHLIESTDARIAEVELEESKQKTFRGLMSYQGKKRWIDMSMEERREAFEATYGTERIVTLDHHAQFKRGGGRLIDNFRSAIHSHGANVIFVDHITLQVSEEGGGGLSDQDEMMAEYLNLAEGENVHVALVSHLRKSPSAANPWSRGAIPDMESLKGSGSLYQISADIVGVARNLHSDDEYDRNVSSLHVLKCRETGKTGPADRIFYDYVTGTLMPARDDYSYNEGDMF